MFTSKPLQPKNAEDIGVWQDMIDILSVLAIIYNLALVFFTGRYLQDMQWQYRWTLLALLELAALAIRYAIQSTLSVRPREVEIQLER